MRLVVLPTMSYHLGVSVPPDLYVKSAFSRQLSLYLVDVLQRAHESSRQKSKNWLLSGSGRQVRGQVFRQDFLAEIVATGAGYGVTQHLVDGMGFVAPPQRDPLAGDLLRVRDLYVVPRRILDCGRFMNRCSPTMSQVAEHAECGRPLFPSQFDVYFAILFYEVDQELDALVRIGVGAPDPTLRRVGLEYIPDLNAHALSQRAPTNQTALLDLRYRDDEDSGSGEAPSDSAPDEDGN